ncbi:MAG: hypothetical protein O3B24_09750 [Verrucomicrobia bacterium]|nr:hypothetical protein [Verrucomicrobiota bacterium]
MNRGRDQRRQAGAVRLRIATLFVLLNLLGAGCASSSLKTARTQFYQSQFDASAATLAELPGNDTDRVLVLMERGTINQVRTNHAAAVEDWLRADILANRLDLLSVSRGTTSMLINDNVLAYCGAPYERVLLHAFAAQSYMALGLWQDAAVEGRALIRRVENRGDYPDDPYSRYVTALSLELMGDSAGAAYQYRQASVLAKSCSISPKTGALGPPVDTNNLPVLSESPPPHTGQELVCFVSIGRAPSHHGYSGTNLRWGQNPYAEFYDGDTYLGRSYVLMRTDDLFAATQKVIATRKTVKTATRIALKETAAQAVASQDEALGDLVRLILFAIETPDTRQWETLPQWLAIARIPCPQNLDSYRIVLKDGSGKVIEQRTVTSPLIRRDKRFVSLYRAL